MISLMVRKWDDKMSSKREYRNALHLLGSTESILNWGFAHRPKTLPTEIWLSKMPENMNGFGIKIDIREDFAHDGSFTTDL